MTTHQGIDGMPRPRRPKAQAEAQAQVAAVTGVGAEVVLVVDDSATVRAYHRAILADAGFEVREAVNGYEALELTLGERFALLVVDVNMPVLDGYQLIEAVRGRALFPQVPIIVVSTEQDESDAAEAYRRGADLFLVKPTDQEQLARTARLLIDRSIHGAGSAAGGLA